MYLLAGALLKPDVDRRQLTIYAPSRAKILSRTSAVLWSLVRWAEPSHKPRKARAFKNLFSHSLSLEKQGHMLVTSREQRSCVGQLAAVAFGSFFSSSAAFLCFPSAGDAWFGSSWHSGGATGREGVGVMLLTPCESWGFGGGVNAEQPQQRRLLSSLPSVYLSIFSSCLFLCALGACRLACRCLCCRAIDWPRGDVRLAGFNAEVCFCLKAQPLGGSFGFLHTATHSWVCLESTVNHASIQLKECETTHRLKALSNLF